MKTPGKPDLHNIRLVLALKDDKGDTINMNILLWLISGIIAGWLTGLIMKGGGFGLIGDLIVGLLGGLIGGFLAGLVGVEATNWLGQILIAVVGGIVLVAVLRLIRRA
jgi:uncharacterized membrane protein YeaQ/YmgE (transglycosylase-associated protein family)